MPEGDAIYRAARRLQVLVGQRLEVEAPHPRARATQVADHVDGRRLESVEAVGKNLLLRFEGGAVVRSHLRMSGRWTVRPRGQAQRGRPWLVLRGEREEALLWNGPVLELHARAIARLGPDVLERPPRLDTMLERARAADPARRLGEILLDQTIVAGIGTIWMAESLWEARLSPWGRLGDLSDSELRLVLDAAARLMRAAVDAPGKPRRRVYGRVGRPCPRCGTPIRARGIGDESRTAHWCPACQPD